MAPLFFRLRAHSVSLLLVHIVWSTRHRAPCLLATTDAWLAALLDRTARGIECEVIAVGNAADHVHALVAYPPRLAVATITQSLKGASSRALSVRMSSPHPWQVGYWAESVGARELEPLIHYVRNQRAYHDALAEPEPWEHPHLSR